MNGLLNAYNGLREMDILKIGCWLGVALAILVMIRRVLFKKVILYIILTGLIGLGYRYHRQVGRGFFPMPYRETIIENARKNQLDPALVAAVIYVESKFDPQAVSYRGAIGLMQIMPETGQWVADQVGLQAVDRRKLRSYETNIFIGTWYLRYLLDQIDQDPVVALAAYNAGWNRVQEWLRDDVWDGRLDNLEQIPYPETRSYVQRVLKVYRIYRYLYPQTSQLTTME